MPTNTPNFNLEKPNVEEFYDVGVQNANIDKIDTTLKTLTDVVADGVTQEDLTVIDAKLDDINQGVGEINGKSDQIKQNTETIKTTTNATKTAVDNIITKINAGVGKVLKSKVFTSNGTFVVPLGVNEVYLTGGGAGGGGGGTTDNGGTGGSTSFGNLKTLPGGAGGISGANGGLGGNSGGPGGTGGSSGGADVSQGLGGGDGGSSGIYRGGFGAKSEHASTAQSGAYCSGGGGIYIINSSSNNCAGGGGGGDFIYDFPITVTPGSNISITVGIGGSNGGASSGKGGNGILMVKWWE